MAFVSNITPAHKITDYYFEGKQIALTGQPGYPTKLARHNGDWWPEAKRVEAATVFAVVRDLEKTSNLVKIPIKDLKFFQDQPWWDEYIARVVKGKNDVLDAKITEVLDQALDVIKDRLENGEVTYNAKTGEERRLPVRARDAATVAAVLFDKRQLIRGEATSRSETLSPEAKLANLKENFEKLAKSKGINANAEIIEGEAHESTEGTSEGETAPEWQSEMRGSSGQQEAGWLSSSQSEGQVNEEGQSVSEASPVQSEGFQGFQPEAATR